MRDTSNAAEDGTLHEMIRVAPKSVDDVVVVPNVELWYHAVGIGEWLCAVPPNVVLQVPLVTIGPQFLIEMVFSSLMWIGDVCPWTKRPCDADAVIVDFYNQVSNCWKMSGSDRHTIPSTNHDVYGQLLMVPEDVVPERCTRPSIFIRAYGEAVA